MSITIGEIRSGVYYDSVVLMQLQRSLTGQPDVLDAGVVMGTDANKSLLGQSGLLSTEVQSGSPDDLLIVVRAENEVSARTALEQVDQLLSARRSSSGDQEYSPKSLESAAHLMPEAQCSSHPWATRLALP
jgi:FdrA protein